MKIEGDNSLEAGNYQQVRGNPCANRFPPVCPAILTRISEVRNYGSKPDAPARRQASARKSNSIK